jgi:hypothetical protein
MMAYTTPTNKDEWWELVDRQWGNLLDVVGKYIDLHHVAYNVPGDPSSGEKKTDENNSQMRCCYDMKRMKEERNGQIARYFFGAWDSAPDAIGIHADPGWNLLCVLLSEEECLYSRE